MKKILLVSLCSALSLSVLSTGYTLNDKTIKEPSKDHAVIITQSSSPAIETDAYASNYITLIEKMDKLAESEDYIKAVSASKELGKIISSIGGADYSTPKAIYKSLITEGSIPSLEIKNLPSDIGEILENKYIASIPSQINVSGGTTELAAASLLSLGECIMAKDITEPTVYVFLYNNDYSAVVTVIPGTDGAVSASTCFVNTKNFKDILNANDLNTFFKDELSLKNLDFKEVSM